MSGPRNYARDELIAWNRRMLHGQEPDFTMLLDRAIRAGLAGRLPMPDVTPKTESGRALHDAYGGGGIGNLILAIEQEAASKAVAEYRTALIKEFQSSGSYNRIAIWQAIDRAALIASERKP